MGTQTYCREDLIFLATTCETCGLFAEMRVYVKVLVTEGFELTPVERHLFSIAYKNIVGRLRSSWRSLKSFQCEADITDLHRSKIVEILSRIESEIRDVVTDVLDQLCNHILPTCTGHEAKVYYLKLQGDYQRYMTEISAGKTHDDWAGKGYTSYKTAADLALTMLPPISSTRLGLMMNFSVFYYEVYHSAERACLLTKTAYDDAIDGGLLDSHRILENGDEYNDSLAILKLLKSNLKLWTKGLAPPRC